MSESRSYFVTQYSENESSQVSNTNETASATPRTSKAEQSRSEWVSGGLASFICHAAHLEKNLNADDSIFFDVEHEVTGSRTRLGEGASFLVERAEWKQKDSISRRSRQVRNWGQYVALKNVVVRENSAIGRRSGNWQDILLEIRALLHEPLRYHPNIVRVLGLGWGPSKDSSSAYPLLVMEFAAYGSMQSLQSSAPPLPFRAKQKLCYDVSRGLSILHACGIVHSDLKHENVLVFENRYRATEGFPWTAKLADFGGAVMDIAHESSNRLRMGTFPYEAPDTSKQLSEIEVKNTDVYSFGLLIWRTMIDGKSFLSELNLDMTGFEDTRQALQKAKEDDLLLTDAVSSIQRYAQAHPMNEQAFELVLFALRKTIRAKSNDRSLPHAQAALRGMHLAEIDEFLAEMQVHNTRDNEAYDSKAPGHHGITVDGLGYFLGKLGDYYDPQNNIPGLRTRLSHPDQGEFLFEPEKLKSLLSWTQQAQMVREFEEAFTAPQARKDMPKPYQLAYYLFICYLTEFGVEFDGERACRWLFEASKENRGGDVDYFSQAWIWRITDALGIQLAIPPNTLKSYIRMSIARGHRTCIDDSKAIASTFTNNDERTRWENDMGGAERFLLAISSGVGMPHYLPEKLLTSFSLDNLEKLDSELRSLLGSKFESCLQSKEDTKLLSDDSNYQDTKSSFDEIYVDRVGHGLLHYAATFGKIDTLRHLIGKYKLNINIQSQRVYETPLVCACRSGRVECAVYLLECGADPDMEDHAEEAPLHWLCGFQENQMMDMAQRLLEKGAKLERASGVMRPEIRRINADWEHLFSISVTPLGRAVIMRSLPAVRTLLELGADPTAKMDLKADKVGRSAVELAAILALPSILEVLLLYTSEIRPGEALIFDENGMLEAARSRQILPFDPLTLHSRLVRSGAAYKSDLRRTISLLQDRHRNLRSWRNANAPAPVGSALCREVELGNADIVEALLELGHDPNGSPEYRPIEKAVSSNHERIFRLLVNRGADIQVRRTLDNGSHLSLLHVCASKSGKVRPGLFIAEYLIRAGLPINLPRDGSPSTLTAAVRSQNFELADLLLDNGADVDAEHQIDPSKDWITLLGQLTLEHTWYSLEAIKYLLGRRTQNTKEALDTAFSDPVDIAKLSIGSNDWPNRSLPSPIVNKTKNLNAIQYLAGLDPEKLNSTSQISSRIIQLVLEAYGTNESLNYNHPSLATPLIMASMTGNVEMVAALCSAGADPGIPWKTIKLDGEQVSATPLVLTLSTFERVLGQLKQAKGPLNEDHKKIWSLLDTYAAVVDTLILHGSPEQDGKYVEKWEMLQADKAMLEKAKKENARKAALDASLQEGDQDVKPANLSFMTEERPTNWKEGDEIDEETSARVFLRYMRTGKG